MAKPGFLNILAPLALGAAGLAAPELLGAVLPAEAAAGGAAEAAPFLIPGTETALTGAETIPLASFGSDIAAAAPGLAGAAPGLAGAAEAAGGLGGVAPNLLAATSDVAAQAAPQLASAAPSLTGADVSGISAPTSAAPAGGGFLGGTPPPGAVSPDFTLQGPPAGADVFTGATYPGAASGTLTPPAGAVGAPTEIAPATITPGGPGLTAAAGTPGGGIPSAEAYNAFTPAQQVAADVAADPTGTGVAASDSAVAGGGGGFGGFASDAGEWAKKNPGALLTAGLFGSQLFKGNPPFPAETKVGNLGAAAQGTATQLTSPLNTGILPPGAQQEVDASTHAAIAQTKSAYGNLGLTGSTMEADKISQIKQNAAAQQFGIANNLLQQGAQYSSIAGNDYNAVLNAQMARDEQYRNALYGFARSLAGAGYSPPAYAAAATA